MRTNYYLCSKGSISLIKGFEKLRCDFKSFKDKQIKSLEPG